MIKDINVDSGTSSPACTKPIVKCSFVSVLKQFGFKILGRRGDDVKIYSTKNGQRYAEIIKYMGWSEVWIVGNNIPSNSTMSYPGGSTFSEPVKLLECLNNCT